MENMTYKKWLEWHAEDLKWIVEMAAIGIKATPNAGNHPGNLVLYMLECDVESVIDSRGLMEIPPRLENKEEACNE